MNLETKLPDFSLWTLTFLFAITGVFYLKPLFQKLRGRLTQNREIEALRRAVHHLKLIQEFLETGLVPDREAWDQVLRFPAPWGKVMHSSLQELRAQGAAVLPSLRRMQLTLEEQVEIIQESKVKSAQAMGQAVLGLILVPLFGFALYEFLPGMEEHLQGFVFLLLFSLFLSCIAFIWMLSMVEEAQFANLPSDFRSWPISANATLERILALLSTGLPHDLAWRKAVLELSHLEPALAQAWGMQVWDATTQSLSFSVKENEGEILLKRIGLEIRKSIQVSLVEGRPSLDRMESLHRAFLSDLKMLIGKELSLLPNRCLKPLFIFVLPSVMILMMGSFAICMQGWMGE